MKLKDFFSKTTEQGGIKDHTEFISTLPDVEIPDEFFPAFEGSFLTKDRAVTDPAVTKKIRANILDPIDQELMEIIKDFDHPDVPKVKLEKSTYDRMSMVKKMIPDIISKVRKDPDNEETKKQLAALKRANEEWEGKYQSRENDFTKQINDIKKSSEEQIKSYKLNTVLEKMSGKYTFAEAYEKNREALQKALLGDLKTKNVLQYTVKENGEEDIHVLAPDEHGTLIPKFNGNTPVTAKSLLDEAYKPFLKVSNGQEPHPIQVIQPPALKPGTSMPKRNTG